jgi:preprotein translocase subunit SecE
MGQRPPKGTARNHCTSNTHSNNEKVDDVADGNAVQDRRDSRGDDRGRTSPATFLRQVVAELRKVVWPTQQQLITYFFVVLVFVIAVMAIVTLLDLAFGKLVFEVFTGSNTQ